MILRPQYARRKYGWPIAIQTLNQGKVEAAGFVARLQGWGVAGLRGSKEFEECRLLINWCATAASGRGTKRQVRRYRDVRRSAAYVPACTRKPPRNRTRRCARSPVFG